MPRKGQPRPRAPVGDVRDPDSLYHYLLRFSEWQAEKNYSPRTIGNRETALRYFISWSADRGLTRPQEITKPILERYQRHLSAPQEGRRAVLGAHPDRLHHADPGVLQVAAWRNHILYNPASELELPRQERRRRSTS